MRRTLAKLLAQAVSEIAAFKTTSIEPDKYIDWVDKYQVRTGYYSGVYSTSTCRNSYVGNQVKVEELYNRTLNQDGINLYRQI